MNKRTSKKRRSSRFAVAFVTAILVVLAIMPTVSANNVEWTEIYSGNVTTSSVMEYVTIAENYDFISISITSQTNSTCLLSLEYGNSFSSETMRPKETPYTFEGSREELFLTYFTDPEENAEDIASASLPFRLKVSTQTINDVVNVTFNGGNEAEPEPFGGGLITSFFSGFGGVITGLATGVKDMFTALVFTNGQLSHFAKFGFLMMGLSLALGLGYFIIRKIRG